MNPYVVLQVERTSTLREIKDAYRLRSKATHPDSGLPGASDEAFSDVKLAFDILSSAERRERYDTTGRIDISRVTPKAVSRYLESVFDNVVNAERPDGSTDDVDSENVLDKIIRSLRGSRPNARQQLVAATRKLNRAKKLKRRFLMKTDKTDVVGVILEEQVKKKQEAVNELEDALELSEQAEQLLRENYSYDVSPDAEGQDTPGPTIRVLSGPGGRATFVRE